jgi:hypothetical protein
MICYFPKLIGIKNQVIFLKSIKNIPDHRLLVVEFFEEPESDDFELPESEELLVRVPDDFPDEEDLTAELPAPDLLMELFTLPEE